MSSVSIISEEFKNEIYSFLNNEIVIAEIEQWIYTNADTLEKELNDNTFLELISFSYQLPSAKHELVKLLKPLINDGNYEKYRLLHLLYKTLDPETATPKMIAQFYDLYCHGYGFFTDVAFPYGLECDYLPLSQKEKSKDVLVYYPKIAVEIQKVINWIENEEIVPISMTDDDYPRYDYEDSRPASTIKQLESTYYKPLKKWWQFWK